MAGAEVVISNGSITETLADGTVRMSKLRSALEKTVKACVSTLNYDYLKGNFKPKSREDKQMLYGIHSQFREKALALVRDEIVLMIREENVEQILIKLDELCKQSSLQSGMVLWRPTGAPVDDVSAQLLPVLMVLRQKLKALISDVQAETDRMLRSVLERQRLIENLKTEIAQNAKLLSGC